MDDNSHGRLAPFSCEFRKTTLLVFLSLPAHAAVAPLFCTARKGGKSRPRGVPPLGYLPLGVVLHNQAVEAGKKSGIASSLNFQAHTWADAADATGTLGV